MSRFVRGYLWGSVIPMGLGGAFGALYCSTTVASHYRDSSPAIKIPFTIGGFMVGAGSGTLLGLCWPITFPTMIALEKH